MRCPNDNPWISIERRKLIARRDLAASYFTIAPYVSGKPFRLRATLHRLFVL